MSVSKLFVWGCLHYEFKASCPQPHQFAEYVKPLRIILWVNAPPDIGSRSTGLGLFPFVMNHELNCHRSWKMGIWRRRCKRTSAKPVLTFRMLPGFWWKTQTSPAPYREDVQVEQISNCDTGRSQDGKQVTACFSLISRPNYVPIFDQVFTCDKTISEHGRYCFSPRDFVPHITKWALHAHNSMLCIWWTSRQVAQYELLETCQIITAELSLQQLMHVQELLKEKEPTLVNHSCVQFLHCNANTHLAQMATNSIWRLAGRSCDISLTTGPCANRLSHTSIPFVRNSLEIR